MNSRLIVSALCLLLCICTTLANHHGPTLTIVNVFARQKAVQEGHQAVIQCQIWNIRRNDVISLTKIRNGVSKTLVYNGNLVVDKRNYFLSKYASKDGATYYVLKIKTTSKEDAGNYTFGVGRPIRGRLRTVAVDSVVMDVHYLPGPGSPSCVPTGRLILTAGDTPELSCASEEGNPQVKLYWQMKDTQKKLKSITRTRNRVQTSTIKIEVTSEDNGATFICALYSHPYRNQPPRNCTVGPIRVVNRTESSATTDTEFDTEFKSETDLENHLIVSITIIAIIISTMIFAVLLMMIMTRRRRKMDLQKRMYQKGEYDEVIVNDPREKIIKNDYPEPVEEPVAYSTTIPQSELDGRNVNIAIHLNLTDTTCVAAISAENANNNVPPEYAVAAVNVNSFYPEATSIDDGDDVVENIKPQEVIEDNTPEIVPNDDESSDKQFLVREIVEEKCIAQNVEKLAHANCIDGSIDVAYTKPVREIVEDIEEKCIATNVEKLAHAHFIDGSNDVAYTIPNKQQANQDATSSPKLSVFFSSIDI